MLPLTSAGKMCKREEAREKCVKAKKRGKNYIKITDALLIG